MRIILALAALAAVCGCASNSQPSADGSSGKMVVASAAPASAPTQVCHRELPTGSNIPVTVCEAAVSDADRRSQIEAIQNQIRNQTPERAPSAGR